MRRRINRSRMAAAVVLVLVIIRKQTDPDEDPNTTLFGYTKSFSTDPVSAKTFQLTDDGVKNYHDTVLFGSGYTVTSFSISGATVTFSIDADTDILDCTYTNELQLGARKILKNSTEGGAVSTAGAVFSYDGSSVTDNGAGDEDPDVGEVCVSGLSLGDYTVNETSPPPGYGDASRCDRGGYSSVRAISASSSAR